MPVTTPKYKKPKYAVDDVVILLDNGSTYVQAKILQANTNMDGEWLYRVHKDIAEFPFRDDDVIDRA